MKALPCLPDETLLAYQAGSADHDTIEAVASHLSSCPTCLNRLQAVETKGDHLLQALRRQQANPPLPLDPLVSAAIAQTLIPAKALAAGTTLNEYRILEKLGSGGMGAVYRALHVRLDKEVALKVIHLRRGNDPQLREWFQREMRAIGKLRHPHIALATDAGEANGVLYLVMELERGIDLTRYVRERGPLPVAEACDYARQAALGLQYAHESGLVHRDVKPSNLFRLTNGQIKVLDLGLALFAASDDELTDGERPAGPLGTDEYMAPEQWTRAHNVDSRADLYSLGCTLFYLLTGQPALPISLPAKRLQACEAHLHQRPRKIRSLRSDVPPQLETLLDQLLAKQPQERPSSATEVARQLAAFAQPKQRKLVWVAAATALLMVIIAAPLIATNPFRPAVANVPNQPAQIPVAPPPAKIEEPATALPVPVAPKPPAPPKPGLLPMHSAEAQELQRKWAMHVKRSVTFTNSVDMKLALVPPGSFPDADGQDSTIAQPFFLGTTEVTIRQFRQFVEAERYVTQAEDNGKGGTLIDAVNPARSQQSPAYRWSSPGYAPASEDTPVVHVTWNDAFAFCVWLSHKDKANYRLPTGEEWAWAARCGEEGLDYRGSQEQLAEVAWMKDNAENHPHDVRTRHPNPWGLYDLHGNVAEWCRDDYDAERLAKITGRPAVFPGLLRVVAGSNYTSVRAQYRLHISRSPPESATTTVGFRVVCEVPAGSSSSP